MLNFADPEGVVPPLSGYKKPDPNPRLARQARREGLRTKFSSRRLLRLNKDREDRLCSDCCREYDRCFPADIFGAESLTS